MQRDPAPSHGARERALLGVGDWGIGGIGGIGGNEGVDVAQMYHSCRRSHR
ncbi:MAG: hypothetical protein SAJ37_02860 [Oscillatoria sp. PMC 1068.18]|nr:hypothetical protein [Oscillatoria sp. PMC 1076.18]MEC4987664.1 hypothetical protein [Oscillatoria sp. PMC 1068.18]